jgi:repressor LexA
MELTPRQLDILRFISRFRRQNGYGPTLEEIAGHLGVSKVTVHEHAERLRDKRMLTNRRGARRGADLTAQARQWLAAQEQSAHGPGVIPLVGVIAAGQPLEAIQGEDTLDLGDLVGGDDDRFALRVRGDSMIEDQICDGDYVIVHRRSTARDGQIVVAILPGGEATLKRIYREPNRIRLQPSNPTMEPIYVTENVDIQGVVIGVLRKYR